MKKYLLLLLIAFASNEFVYSQCAYTALQFDGADDYINCGSNSSLMNTGNTITLEVWLNPASNAAFKMILSREGEYECALDNGIFSFALANSSPGWVWVSSGINVPLNTWTHIALVYDGSTVKVYKDGILGYSGLASGNLGDFHTNWNEFWIGYRQANIGNRFHGFTDEVRVWNVALSQTTIQTWKNKMVMASHPNYPNLKGYWKLDEGAGTSAADGSGNGNNGTLTNGPVWVNSGAVISCPPAVNTFSPTSGYSGSTITVTGTGFTGASIVTIGGTNVTSFTVVDANTITAEVGSGTTGQISVTTPGGTASSSSNFTYNGYISVANGNWNATATWLGGSVPPAGSSVTVNHVVSLNISTSVGAGKSIIVNGTLQCGANAISGAGSFILNPDATLGSGNANGISGSITTANRNLSTGANYIFNGNGMQNTGGMPTTIKSLTIANTGSPGFNKVNLWQSPLNITGAPNSLFLQSGLLTIQAIGIYMPLNGGITATAGDLDPQYPGYIYCGSGGTVTMTGNINFGEIQVYNNTHLTFNGNCTIKSRLDLQSGAGTVTGSPTYLANSQLRYSNGTTYTRGDEWTSLSGPGYPQQIYIGTHLTINNGNPTALIGCADMVVIAGTLDMTGMSVPLTVGWLNYAGNASNPVKKIILSDLPGGDLKMNGPFWSLLLSNFITNGRKVILFGSANQTIQGNTTALTFDKLVIDKSGGIVTINNDINISQELSLVNGKISTGINKVVIGNNGVITGNSNTNFIVGNLQRGINAGTSSVSFPIGDATIYRPVVIDFNGVPAGNLLARVSQTVGDHPNIGSSNLNAAKSVNRFWTLTDVNNTLISGTYDATFEFVAADKDAGANASNFNVGKYENSNWTYPASVAIDALHTKITGANDFSDFAIAEVVCTAPVPNVTNLPPVSGQCSVTVTAPTATSNCFGQITGITTDPVTYNNQGTYTIHWTYDDGNGNTSSQTQTVIVQDNTAPVPNVANLPTVTEQCSATVTVPAATDNCTGTVTATTNDPLSYTAQGTYTVHWTYNDGNGNTSSQNQTVIVQDNTAPVPNVANLPTVTGQCSASVTAPTATDNCAGTITATTTDPTSYSAQGTYTINWTYNDGNGNTSTQTQTVVVNDITAPVPDLASLSTVTGQCSATVTAPTATDNCAGTITATTTDPTSYSAQGTYTINWTYNDGNGNTSTQNQTVIVNDITPPVLIDCPTNIILSACQSTATWMPPTASDNCTGVTVTRIAGPASGSSFANGTTTMITYKATDAAGNQETCTFSVTRAETLTATSSASSNLCSPGNSTITVNGSGGTAPYSGTGIFPMSSGTHNFTIADSDGCIASTSLTITLPAPLTATCTTNNSILYYGYTGDQTATINVKPSGGVGPYQVVVTMNRPLKCNIITSSGDEVWTSGANTANTANTTCPISGSATLHPASTSNNTINSTTGYSINVTLMQNAVIMATVTDANGCITTCSINIQAEDVRCFSGNSGVSKVTLCHQTGSTTKPCVTICVDESAVAQHIAHGDFFGKCTPNCMPPVFNGGGPGNNNLATMEIMPSDDLQVIVLPNPSESYFTLKIRGINSENVNINVTDILGKTLYSNSGAVSGMYKFGQMFIAGVYFVEVRQGSQRQILKVIKK